MVSYGVTTKTKPTDTRFTVGFYDTLQEAERHMASRPKKAHRLWFLYDDGTAEERTPAS